MNTIVMNNLLRLENHSGEYFTERILWIDKDSIIAFTIDINKSTSVPIKRKISEIEEGLTDGSIIKLDEDPWLRILTEDELDSKDKVIRDNAWLVIKDIVSDNAEPDIYNKEKRRKLILEACATSSVCERTVYRYLQKYWIRGKTKNALLPEFQKCGGEGKGREIGEKKLGRPRKNQDILGIGLNVDEETKKIFRKAIKDFYYESTENSLKTAYTLMIKEYYSDKIICDDGTIKVIMKSIDEIHSFDQFRYFYENNRDIKEEVSGRKGGKNYELEHRAVLGNSTQEALGPGFLYQIDSTVADVYLVSRYNKEWIIGRPIVYTVIDVFSRLITGIYVGLEGPSWIGEMMALANAATDKVSFCAEYGIKIAEEQWPSHHLPESILGDRGEHESKKIEGLVNTFGIKIANTSSYRADMKGIVEQNFRVLNEKVKPFVPGFVKPDYRKRGEKDYRLEAELDIYEFTRIIIECVLHHNAHWLKSYERESMMVADDVDPIPIKLWEWGVKNRAGLLRSFPEDIVKLNLMPRGNASITFKGIKFKNLFYTCEIALQENWFDLAKDKGTWKVPIAYDPRNMNYIYIIHKGGKSYDKCLLSDLKSRYKDKSIDEIDYLIESEKISEKQNRESELQSKINLYSEIQTTSNKDTNENGKVQTQGQSNSSKVKGIRKNRQYEKERNREAEAFELGEIEFDDTVQIITTVDKTEENLENAENSPSQENPDECQEGETENSQEDAMEILRRLQKERLNGNTR